MTPPADITRARATIRIFVSSPGDVQQERQLAARVIARLAGAYPHAAIEAVFWEHEPLRATASFQEEIPRPSDTDIVVCILWSRIGTRLPSRVARPDGTSYASGTEFEFEDARAAFARLGRPDLLVYRKTARPAGIAPDEDDAIWRERRAQYLALDHFIDTHFRDASDGTFVAAFHPFEDSPRFEELLELHLRKLIERRLPGSGAPSPPFRTWDRGSPFRGLGHFDRDHAPVFFGRTSAVEGVLEAVRTQIADGRAFVVVVGMSGVGKSSLVRAGVVPLLTQPGVIEGVGVWREAVLTPSEATGGTLFDLFARKLLGALPELAADGTTAADLATLLREHPQGAAPLLKGGLSQAASRIQRDESLERQPAARLVLVVDQLEELFTTTSIDAATRAAFGALIDALARSRRVVVLATLRSDHYLRCAEIPGLLALKAGAGTFDLAPPTPSELGQIIRLPAEAAGLRFEIDATTGERLDDVLRDAAIASPEGLPLLESALDELYQRRSDDDVLAHSAYLAIGGVEGAIATRADATLDDLPPPIRDALPSVLRALVSVAPGGKATRRSALLERAARTPEARSLVTALVRSRLLVTSRDETQGDAPIVRVVHEALLDAWPLIRRWIRTEGELLPVRDRLAAQVKLWEERGRPADLLLPRGRPLLEAEALERAWGDDLEANEIALVRASRARVRTGLWIRRAVTAAIVLLAMGMSIAAWRAMLAQRDTAGRLAELYGLRAETLREAGDPATALLYLAKAIEVEPDPEVRDRIRRSSFSILAAQVAVPQAVMIHGADVRMLGFLGRGDRVMTASLDGMARVWDVPSGAPIGEPMRHEQGVWQATASSDGTLVLTGSGDGAARLWEPETGKPVGEPLRHDGLVTAILAPDGTHAATASGDGRVLLWDVRRGVPIGTPMQHELAVTHIAFAPDSSALVTASQDGTARVWSASTAAPIGVPMRHQAMVLAAAFSPDGGKVVTAGFDKTARVWDARSGLALGKPMLHENAIIAAAFSPDGSRIATASFDSTARLWDAATGDALGAPMRHAGPVIRLEFAPDGKALATASFDRTVRIWDAKTGAPMGDPIRHPAMVNGVAFGPDGRHLATATAGGTVRLWRIGGRAPELVLVRGEKRIVSAAFGPGGTRLLTASWDRTARVWNTKTGAPIGAPMEHPAPLRSAAFSPDGAIVATTCDDGIVRLWNAATGAAIGELSTSGISAESVSFSPDGARLVTAGPGGAAQIWDVARREPVGAPLRHERLAVPIPSLKAAGLEDFDAADVEEQVRAQTSKVESAVFDADGTRVVTAGWDQTARLWSVPDGKAVGAPMRHEAPVNAATFDPIGARVLTVSGDGTARLWNARDVTPATDALKHGASVRAGSFSPDGTLVVTASDDGTARIWDARTGEPRGEPMRHDGAVGAVAFSPDGALLATASEDHSARIWDARTGSPIGPPLRHAGAVTSLRFAPDGEHVATASEDGTARIWDLAPERRDVAILAAWAEAASASTLDTGTLTPLSPEDVQVRVAALWARAPEIFTLAPGDGEPTPSDQ